MRTPLPGQLQPMRACGPQLFVDWRYVRGGHVPWFAGGERIGVWDPAPVGTRGQPRAPSGIRLQAQPAQKLGPLGFRDRPWEYGYNFSTVIKDEGVYRLWYECVPGDHFEGGKLGWPTGHGNVLCYAESDDGFTWRKPRLGIAAYNGETGTNIVYGRELSSNGLHGASVFKDPNAPPAERYKLIYMGMISGIDVEEWQARHRSRFGDDMDPMALHKGEAKPGGADGGHLQRDRPREYVQVIAGATSPDGLRWTALPEPLMVHFSDTLNTASWDPALGRYVGYFRTWRHGRRCVGRAETEDFARWPSTPDTVLMAPLDAHPSDDVYTNAKALYPGSDAVHLMFPAIYHRLEDSRRVHLASSTDGVNWQWVPGGPVIDRDPLGSWSGGDVATGHGLVPLAEDRIAIPFKGYVYPHKYPRGSELFGAAGWATWPRGRLCALQADERGEFTTPELVFAGRELSLNVETAHSGEVLVELQDETGSPIPGFSFAEAEPIVANSLDERVTWRGGGELGTHAGRPVALAFRLRSAKLFAFEFVG